MSFDLRAAPATPPRPARAAVFYPDLDVLWPEHFSFLLNNLICPFSERFLGGGILILTFHGKVTSHQTVFNHSAFPASWGFHRAPFDRSVNISDLKCAEERKRKKRKRSRSLDSSRSTRGKI